MKLPYIAMSTPSLQYQVTLRAEALTLVRHSEDFSGGGILG